MIRTDALSSEPWGTLPDGTPLRLFTLRNASGMRVAISDLGATLVSWLAPDRNGTPGEILLGHDTPADYLESTTYMGGLIGRWANRIAGAHVEIDGVGYALDRNEGGNLLHGGASGFHRARWDVVEDDGALVMRHRSPDGDAGFPGNVAVQVRYTLDDDGTLTIQYEATTDAPTPLNLTSHGYFNLSGAADADADVRNHRLSIDADSFFEVDDTMIPCDRAKVGGRAFDFRESAQIGERLDWRDAQLDRAKGIDHCYVLRASDEASAGRQPVRRVASVYEPSSGRELTVATDQPGLQCYTGNYLQGERGRGDATYRAHSGVCLEAGGFPDQVHMAGRDAVILRAGQTYRQTTQYCVSVKTAA
ncbi:aldose epimerase family protein [Paraburkholderia sp.]|uniref:aldose epimerase family protein n=1 Tax=Paraburkholderia sp. TaxID=1926495 RepID=UPI00239662C9|nr:aldose epimerase family protein [Paraburkholderia sp.]MDE1184002.1 galactose mutarotase [Paraburkholderia sp.]